MKGLMNRTWVLIFFAALVMVTTMGTGRLSPGRDPLQEERDLQAVTAVVEEFGRRLKQVSLLGPGDAVRESMREKYGDLVLPELIESWCKDPLKAPGRLTSSPWPDRIEISRVTGMSPDLYRVEGRTIEITTVEMVGGGAAAIRPVIVSVQRTSRGWFISDVVMGQY